MHALRLGKTNGATHQPFDPRAQVDVLALDFLRVFLPHVMCLCIEMPLVGALPVGVKLRNPKGRQQCFELQKHLVLPSAEDVRQHLPRVVINGMPQPAWVRFAAHVTPHFVQL